MATDDMASRGGNTRHMSRIWWALATAAIAAALTACSNGQEQTFPDDSFAVIANADIGTGTSRILVGVVGPGGERLGSPDQTVAFEVFPSGAPEAGTQVPATWMWIVEPALGLWRADVELDREGPWTVVVTPEHGELLPAAQFIALAATAAPSIGEVAPVVATPTLTDRSIEALTTDDSPDPRFYRTSLDQAIAEGNETVLVFSTPAYCVSAACGPLLDIVKEVAPDFPETEFIHVEVYEGFDQPNFVRSR